MRLLQTELQRDGIWKTADEKGLGTLEYCGYLVILREYERLSATFREGYGQIVE
jgi:hypothetical protein